MKSRNLAVKNHGGLRNWNSAIWQAFPDSCLIWQLSDLTAVRPDSCRTEKFQAKFSIIFYIQENYLLQNFSLANPFCTELKCMELNWSFISQNSIINQFTFERWKFTRKQAHLSHVVFLKTCPLWKCMKIAMTKEGNKMILFFFLFSLKSTANKRKICCFL